MQTPIDASEFLWRHHKLHPTSQWYGAGLWPLLDLIATAQQIKPTLKTPDTLFTVSDAMALQFALWKEETQNDNYEPLVPGAAVPAAAAANPNTPILYPGNLNLPAPWNESDDDRILGESDSDNEGSESECTEISVNRFGVEKGSAIWQDQVKEEKEG